MKKLSLTLFTAVALIKVQAQCSITATPLTSTITCGQSVQLTSSTTGGATTMSNDFNLGSAGAGWTTTSGADFTNPCGPSTNGTTYLWMGAGSAAPRSVETVPLNINCGGSICFDLRFSVQGGASPCEGPDLATEGVFLQYTTNGGVVWNTIFYFDPNINNSGGSAASPYTTWANYCFPIPAGAISPTTAFRWSQTAVSANVNDHWGIDNVVISGTCANPYSFIWTPGASLSATNIGNPIASPTSTTTYTVLYTDGITDSCTANVTVNVIQPDVDGGVTQSICLGDTVTLAGSSNTSLQNPVTFTNTTPTSIFDLSTATSTLNVSGLNLTNITTTSINQVCLDITHTWDSDLTLTLQCPGGLQLVLSAANGGAGDNYTQTCFTPSATNVIGSVGFNAAPFTGTFAPEGAGGFGNFVGCLANGTWSLIVTDGAGGDVGTINNWSITFNDNITPNLSWSPSAGMTGSTTFTPTFIPSSTGTYTISLTTYPGCTATDTVSVLVNALPTPNAGANATICVGDSTALNAVGGLTFSWSPSTGLSANNIPNPVATPATTTDYVVTVSNGTCSGKDTVQVLVNPLPPVDAGSNTTICDGTSTNITASGATTYTWTPATGLSATNVANPVSSASATTTYYVTGTDGNGCSLLDSLVITVNPSPVAVAGADISICAGGTGTTLNGSGGGTYSWSPGTGLNSTAIAGPTANPTVTTNYILTVTNGFNCVDKDTVTVTVNALPNVSAGANHVMCAGTSWQLNATGASSYVWTPSATLSNANISNPVATPTANTTYTVVGTDANGCSKSSTVSLIILPAPTVNATNNTAICAGGSVGLSATASVSTYTWSPASGLSSVNTANTTASPTVTTTYTVSVTSGGCVGKDSVTVTVNALPAISAGPNVSVCNGSTLQLTASGGSTYAWSPATGLSASNISNPVFNGTGSATYIITGTDANGCVNKDTILVTVNNLPNVSAGANATHCTGNSTQLNASGATNYSWSPATGLSAGNISNPMSSATSSVTYTVTGTDANGCVNTSSVTITVNPLPTIAVNNSTICPGGSDTLVASGAGNYIWTPAGTPISNDSIVISPSVTTSYTVTGTDANGCTNTATAVATVVAALTSSPIITNVTCNGLCNGSANANITPAGTYTYVWSNGASTATASNLCAGNYTVTATNNAGCAVSSSITITQPANAIAASSTTGNINCFGGSNGSASISVTGGTPNYTYNWSSIGSGSSASNLTAGNYTVTVTDINNCQTTVQFTITSPSQMAASASVSNITCINTTGTINTTVVGGTPGYTYSWMPNGNGQNATGLAAGTYTLTVTDAASCTITQTVVISTNTVAPGATAGSDQVLNCGTGAVVNLNGGSTTMGVTYSWMGPNGYTSTQQNPSVPFAGSYTITTTNPVNGCTSTDIVNVTQASINAAFTASPTSGTFPLSVDFVNGSTNATTYAWTFDNGDFSTAMNDSTTYTSSGVYTVMLIVSNANGCIDTATATITVTEAIKLVVPNIFSPNGDGINEIFFITGDGIKTLEVVLYDRWGLKVGEITSPTQGWNGDGSSDGTYYYMLKATGFDNKEVTQEGYLQLVR